MTKTFSNKFRNANEAFEYWYQCIEHYGTDFAGTKALFNIGFEMAKPYERNITHDWRKFRQTVENNVVLRHMDQVNYGTKS